MQLSRSLNHKNDPGRRHVVKEAKALERGFASRGGIALRELPKAREYLAALERVYPHKYMVENVDGEKST